MLSEANINQLIVGGFAILTTLLAWLIRRVGAVHKQVNTNLAISEAYAEALASILRAHGIEVPKRLIKLGTPIEKGVKINDA